MTTSFVAGRVVRILVIAAAVLLLVYACSVNIFPVPQIRVALEGSATQTPTALAVVPPTYMPTPTPLPTVTPTPTGTPACIRGEGDKCLEFLTPGGPASLRPGCWSYQADGSFVACQYTPTPWPYGTTPMATAAAAAGMKYQYDAGCTATTPMDYPACILQRVQSGELTGEQAVVMIQALGAKFSAPSYEGMELTFANVQPVVAWCPGGASYYPPDTARPLQGTKGAKWAELLFVVDKATGGPDRTIKAKTSACWIAYVR